MIPGKPLISIGVPTYNRPKELERTILAILKQNYSNIEVIVSDNHSPSLETQTLITKLADNDKRIKFIRHDENKGIFFNFYFVLEQARGDYFIWAADDDEWQGITFLDELMRYAPENILTFPDAVIKTSEGTTESVLKDYENCKTKLDYSRAFCSVGVGHPLYGIYNLKLFKEYKLEFKFADDLSYYMEGEFLHKLFITGPAKYVKDACILYSMDSVKPTYDIRLDNFLTYFKRTISIYTLSSLKLEEKDELICLLFDTYIFHSKDILSSIYNTRQAEKLPVKKRIKKALKVLLKGTI